MLLRRRQFLQKHGLLQRPQSNRGTAGTTAALTKEDVNIGKKLQGLARFHGPDEHARLLEGLGEENRLRKRLRFLAQCVPCRAGPPPRQTPHRCR